MEATEKKLPELVYVLMTLCANVDGVSDQLTLNKMDNLAWKWSAQGKNKSFDKVTLPETDKRMDLLSMTVAKIDTILDPLSCALLLKDISELILADNVITVRERKFMDYLKRSWGDHLPRLNDVINGRFGAIDEASLDVPLAAGLLYATMMIVDGSIDRSELTRIQQKVEVWDDLSSRRIFAAINITQAFYVSLSKEELTSKFPDVSEEIFKLAAHCASFLKKNTSVSERKILLGHIIEIAQADGVIHHNENRFKEVVCSIWDDL